mmetsp:Transcript_39351/g.91847  ORF Transcript_39351/g.91847 Transcript_39351/m.91847 type:complete len:270 (+) Transcript_39351:235-1044(+)
MFVVLTTIPQTSLTILLAFPTIIIWTVRFFSILSLLVIIPISDKSARRLNDRARIVRPDVNLILFLLIRRHLPRLENKRRRHLLQLRNPPSQIVPVLIVVLALFHGVEAVQPPAGHAGAGAPVSPVGVYVVVQQLRLEEVGAVPPVGVHVDRQEAAYVLAAAVGHEARRCQLAHVGVYQGVSGPALRPGRKFLRVEAPPATVGMLASGPLSQSSVEHENIVAVLQSEEFEKVPPQQLEDDPVGRLVLFATFFVGGAFGGNAPGADAAVG